MIKFILNNKEISTSEPAGSLLVDFIRYRERLTGTKIGCREGDCGACTVLLGEWIDGRVKYRSFTSCLTPLGNVHGKHVVTIEGLNRQGLNAVQQCIVDASATQCGFCTPGFTVSLTGFCLSEKEHSHQNAIAAMDGNICRCTGYKSLQRAAWNLAELMQQCEDDDRLSFLDEQNILPGYFAGIPDRLANLALQLNGALTSTATFQYAGGGTDLFVQRPDELHGTSIHFLTSRSDLKGIYREDNACVIGPAATVTDLQESPIFQQAFPAFSKQVKLVSSTPIRNMATIAGNFINASPIGDFTIFFLALDAMILLSDGTQQRWLPLRKLYKGYKLLDKRPEEWIEQIRFDLTSAGSLFNFEKVSKRTHLDIASVNSAASFTVIGQVIEEAGISAGGVGPIPLFLKETSDYVKGRTVTEELVTQVVEIANREISPISDARGTAPYKRLLLGQLLRAHFLTLFPSLDLTKLLQQYK